MEGQFVLSLCVSLFRCLTEPFRRDLRILRFSRTHFVNKSSTIRQLCVSSSNGESRLGYLNPIRPSFPPDVIGVAQLSGFQSRDYFVRRIWSLFLTVEKRVDVHFQIDSTEFQHRMAGAASNAHPYLWRKELGVEASDVNRASSSPDLEQLRQLGAWFVAEFGHGNYEKMAAAVARKQELTTEEAVELSRLWKKW